MKSRLKENTWLTKEHIIRTKILPYFGKLKISEISTKEVIAWQNEMLAYRDEKKKPYSQTYLKTQMCIRDSGYLDEIPVCVGYELDGKQIDYFPTATELKRCKPIFEKLPGWKCDIRGIKKFEDLPENARHYVEFAEKHLGVPVCMVSNGPAREDIMYR